MSKLRKTAGTVLACWLLTSVGNFAEDHSIFHGKQMNAERYTVVERGGYFPVMIQLGNKDLVAAVRGGARHVGVTGRLDWVRSKDGGKTWTLTPLVNGPTDLRNPAVGQLQDGTILVSYIMCRGYGPNGEWLKDCHTDGFYTVRSNDGGYNWKEPIKTPIPQENEVSPFGKIIQLPDGTALLNVYYGNAPHAPALIYRSTDNGQTWGDPSVVAEEYNETSLAILPDGRIIAVLRTSTRGRLAVAFSSDKGRTWSPPRQVTQPGEVPADVVVLKDGRLLLVYGERLRPFGVRALISRDLGQTWDPNMLVLVDDAKSSDCGYPSSVEIAPGKIVTMYYGTEEHKLWDTNPAAPDLTGIYARTVLWTVP